MMENERYLRVVRGFGLYHMVTALPLALPLILELTLLLFAALHNGLELPGGWPAFDATSLLFVNLFATLAVVWGYFRWRYASVEIGRIEGYAMIAFALIVSYYVWQGASPLWLTIAIVDSIGALLHLRRL